MVRRGVLPAAVRIVGLGDLLGARHGDPQDTLLLPSRQAVEGRQGTPIIDLVAAIDRALDRLEGPC